MTRRETVSLIILILVIGLGAYKYVNRSFSDTKTRFLLDTYVEISASAQSKTIGKSIDSVFSYIQYLEAKLDEYDENSWITGFNNLAEGYYPMDKDAFRILQIADSLYNMTNGSFDISIKPVFDLWNFSGSDVLDSLGVMAPPDSTLIAERLKLVGFKRINYDEESIFKPAGMQISFGAIAKGYILDRARELMLKLELTNAYISCRSSMTLFESKQPQVIMISHPRNPNQEIASFRIADSSLGTSGDYQQYFEYEGEIYHHILDAHTGYPIQGIYSVTVVNPSAAWADGLSTALFVMDPVAAIEVIKSLSHSNAVIYYDQDDSIVSLKSIGMQELDFSERL